MYKGKRCKKRRISRLMCHGKREQPARYTHRKPAKWLHSAALGTLAAILLVVGVNNTIAYIQDNAYVTNNFDFAVMNPQIQEEFQNNVKENVSVQNNSNTPVYMRAALLFQWKDLTGCILNGAPKEDVDYDLSLLLTEDGWFKGNDGYYYYRKPVAPGESTSVLIQSCTIKDTTADSCYISLDIVVQAIQSAPPEAVEEAWEMVVGENGMLTEGYVGNES